MENILEIVNKKFTGLLDLFEGYWLDVKELIVRDNEIAFSIKVNWGEDGKWDLNGIASRQGNIFVSEKIISNATFNRDFKDKGNVVTFILKDFDKLDGLLEVDADVFCGNEHNVFTGELDLANHGHVGDTRKTESFDTSEETEVKLSAFEDFMANYKPKMIRTFRKKPMPEPFFITLELNEIPLHYRSYIKANRDFLAYVKKYEILFKDISLAENFLEWIDECKDKVSQFEKLIYDFEKPTSTMGIKAFNVDRKEMAQQLLDDLLSNEPYVAPYISEDAPEALEKQCDEIIVMFERIYEDIRGAAVVVYEYWLDAR